MSKTKEEILGQPAYSHECGSFIEVDTRQEVLKAMDAWADQKVEEYKERLKHDLLAMKISKPITDIGESHNTTIDMIINVHL